MNYKNLDECSAFNDLKNLKKVDLAKEINAEKIGNMQTNAGGTLIYAYGGKAVNEEILAKLEELCKEQDVFNQYKAIYNGDVMNIGENRSVLHHLNRGQLGSDVVVGGVNMRSFYEGERERFGKFASDVHAGVIKGSTGSKFENVVQIGIGGSDLGPRAMYLALERAYAKKMKADFISNVDPDDANLVISSLDITKTLFILVSKSGTTSETLANLNFVIESAKKQNIAGFDVREHIIAVTSQTSPLVGNPNFKEAFYIDDFIGGRFSSCSAVGGVLLSLVFGSDVFAEFLAGAHEADTLAMNTTFRQNAALMDAAIGVYERNVLNYTSTAVLPYSQALCRFPAHLQQADMESNGKTCNRAGKKVNYATGPVIFGESGTNGQHSFYQLLHQGSDIIPLQFVGFNEAQTGDDYNFENSTSQAKLKANCAAQMAAFVLGKDDSNENKHFYGSRPVSLLYSNKLTARALGALLAHYENKIMFQGFLWNLNSFDQEGVQLGKLLANQLLKGEGNAELKAFAKLLNL